MFEISESATEIARLSVAAQQISEHISADQAYF